MNETTPPAFPVNVPSQPKTSGLAIWSLVLGIFGIVCFSIFAAIPGVICGHTALSRIKRSGGTLSGQGMAIAGLVIGYLGIAWAIVFIPLMAAIAIPNFVRARQTAQMNACINNLRQIDTAKQQWALENSKGKDAVPTWADLEKYLNAKQPVPLKCPAGGTYTINAVGENPTCTVARHQLSP